MKALGFNPMRWNCENDGCFNVERRPKIEVFADCFPRRINFGDVDGLVELNGFFCLLEWKGDGGSLGRGQIGSFVNFTKPIGNIVFVAHGDAKTMILVAYSCFWEGRHRPMVSGDLGALKERIRKWAAWTETAKAHAKP